MRTTISLIILSLFTICIAQDKGKFVKDKSEFWEKIKTTIEEYEKEEQPEETRFQVELENYEVPTSKDQFTSYKHNEPISQGNTGTCWSFSTTSYLESEVYRIHQKEVKISEMFTVYWEYVEKAEEFVRTRGESYFAEGSEANAVTRIWKDYGCVPGEVYTGLKPGQEFHNHSAMFEEMNTYLESVKEDNAWNEDKVISTIKSILNFHMGEPPVSFIVDGTEYNPESYLKDYLKLNLNDYLDILSYLQQPFWEQVEYEVPDNWWHSKDYYNIPLDEYMSIFKSAIKNGYTICIGGDVSEAGKIAEKDLFIVPAFDIPAEYIDDHSRQFRFSNGTTTDDHGVHVVGWTEINGDEWYLIKDSGASARNGNAKGYYYFHEDYVKLKIMDFMIHKDAVGELLNKF